MGARYRNFNVAIALVGIHLGALAAFWPPFFAWPALILMAALIYCTGGIGVALGFHRTLTHRSLKLWKPIEYVAAIFGCLALQGSPIEWVATHRVHHAHTDRDGDPHDANLGLGWSHFLWLVMPNENLLVDNERFHWAPDLAADPFYRFLDRYHYWMTPLLAIVLFAIGGVPWVVWGVFVRLVVVYHFTWFVNSAAHTIGYRAFRTNDRSTNCWWVALISWGEGWHNNHHAFPFSARHGLRWYEFDITWIAVRTLAALRLATELKLPTDAMLRRLRITTHGPRALRVAARGTSADDAQQRRNAR